MEEGLPYLTAALFCETVIEGKDGVLSAVRIIERATVEIQTDVPGIVATVTPAIAVKALICIKSGPVKGNFNLNIFGQKPSGKRAKLATFPLILEGGEQGQNFVVSITIAVDEEGLYWFDIMFDDRLLTKIPITLLRVHKQEEKSVELQKME
jgi:hypothetical protein